MKTFGNRLMRQGALFLIIPIWLLLAESAGAAEAAGDWRPMYDLILRYVNFIILAFLIIKYARKPLVNFFKEDELQWKTS